MLSVNTKKIMGELLTTIGMGHMQLGAIKSVLANQQKFILEHAYERLLDKSAGKITQNSLKEFLKASNIEATLDEISIIFELYSTFQSNGLSLSE